MKLLFFVLVFISYSSCAGELKFITHSVDGKVYRQSSGELRGVEGSGRRAFYIELVREMMLELDYSNKNIVVYPLKRALKMLKQRPDVAVFSVAQGIRKHWPVKWVGPLQSTSVKLYQASDNAIKTTSLAAAKTLKSICVVNGSAHDKYLIDQDFDNLFRAKNHESCLQMLLSQRAEAMVIGDTSLNETLRVQKVDRASITEVLTLYKTDNYIAFSGNICDSKIKKWQLAFDKIKDTGRYQQLADKYLL